VRDRVRELVVQWVASLVAGLALAGHGQWGFAWFPPEAEDEPGPGELSWAEFERELHALLDAARRDGVGDGPRPGSEPVP
jgi:hypothetical protein